MSSTFFWMKFFVFFCLVQTINYECTLGTSFVSILFVKYDYTQCCDSFSFSVFFIVLIDLISLENRSIRKNTVFNLRKKIAFLFWIFGIEFKCNQCLLHTDSLLFNECVRLNAFSHFFVIFFISKSITFITNTY